MYPVPSYVPPVGQRPLCILANVTGYSEPCHNYQITAFDATTNPHTDYGQNSHKVSLIFQNGPQEHLHTPNGITMEALLNVCLDRLRRFQMGPYPHHYNASAIMGIEQALNALNQRSIEEYSARNLTITTQPT